MLALSNFSIATIRVATIRVANVLFAAVLFAAWLPTSPCVAASVQTTDELVQAARDAVAGETIDVAAGVYPLARPLEIKSGVTLSGAGIGETILTAADSWNPPVTTLPDPEMRTQGLDADAYLIRLEKKASDVTISAMTLRGPKLHGAIFGYANERVVLRDLQIKDFRWSGIRTFAMKDSKIHDCQFIDAGGTWRKGGIPGDKGGISGGAIFAVWISDSEIFGNHISRTGTDRAGNHFGIKGRQGKRCRIHHNTIEVNFSIEFPFENDEDMEIDHNLLNGVVSIPKHAGGPVPQSGRTFHIHHNHFTTSYAIEFVRNGVEIDHNLFDFDPQKDGGNLISGFGKANAAGPAEFHNNLISNPGRGVIWINEVFNNLVVRNNHIITRPTAVGRTDGLFGFNQSADFGTITIRDNVIECLDTPRPLLRQTASYAAKIENNLLTNVADAERLTNPKRDRPVGLESPLVFRCGAGGHRLVSGWTVTD